MCFSIVKWSKTYGSKGWRLLLKSDLFRCQLRHRGAVLGNCQFDRTWTHLGHKPLGKLVRNYIERVEAGGPS